ncbi:Leucine-rich repeat-containing protein 37A2, partial [Heterocephalus glaber]
TVRPADIEVTITQESNEEVESSVHQEAPSQPPGSPMETELSPSQQDQPLLTSETAEEVEISGGQLEALLQTENPLEEVKSPVQEDMPALGTPLGSLVKMLVKNTRTTLAGKEAQPPPRHQQAPASPSESPEGMKPSPTWQKAPSQPPGSPMETELSPSQQDQPLLTSETAEEVEIS